MRVAWARPLRCLFGGSAGDVRLWSRDREHAEALLRTRINERHLPGVVLPEAILVTSRAAEAADGSRSDGGGRSDLVPAGDARGAG